MIENDFKMIFKLVPQPALGQHTCHSEPSVDERKNILISHVHAQPQIWLNTMAFGSLCALDNQAFIYHGRRGGATYHP